MTAAITPKDSPNLVRTDPVARLKDYERALDFYLNFIDRPLHSVIFVENSDSDVTSLRNMVEARNLTKNVSSFFATTPFTDTLSKDEATVN